MSLDQELLNDFFIETNQLIEEVLEQLEEIESDFSQVAKLKECGNKVDRIMGGAKSLATMADPNHGINIIADYTSLCKIVSYRASENKTNEKLYDITVALLLDAIEALKVILPQVNKPTSELKKLISQNFIDRVRWISEQLVQLNLTSSTLKSEPVKSTSTSLAQDEIDELMKKLGF